MPSRILLIGGQDYYAAGSRHIGPWRLTIDTGVTTDFSLRAFSTCNVDIDWGDGNVDTGVALSGSTVTPHNYSAPGTYTVEVTLNSGDFRPLFNVSASGDEIITLGDTPDGWSFGVSLQNAFTGSANLTTVGNIDTSMVTNFGAAWQICPSLTSFSLIDTSSVDSFVAAWAICSNLDNIAALGEQYSFPLIDTSSGTNFQNAWNGCSSLESFPPIITSNGTNFQQAWSNCTSLTSFPLIDTSNGTNFLQAWYNCTSLASFPLIDISSATSLQETWWNCSSLTSFPALPAGKRPVAATTFRRAWRGCSSMTDFPANFFDDWTGTPATNCFAEAWLNCSELTGTSVANILNSIDTSGQSGPGSGFNITINYKVGEDISAVLGANNAVDNLTGYISDVGKGWTVTLSGTLYEKLNP